MAHIILLASCILSVLFLLLLAFSLCKISSRCSRQEEKEEYRAMVRSRQELNDEASVTTDNA